MKEVKKVLGDRVMLKELETTSQIEGTDFVFSSDADELPKAEVIMVSKELKDKVEVEEGDTVLYIKPREKGLVKHKGKEHFIVPVSAIAAIL